MALTALSLGTNLGDRAENLIRASALLEEEFGELKKSPVYESPPFYSCQEGQENFYNCCVSFETELSPAEVFRISSGIEREMGRRRSGRFDPRVIDIDIIFSGDSVIAGEKLTVPHTGLQDRKFVLKPLSDIMGGFMHPAIGLTVNDLYDDCPDKSSLMEIKGFWG